MVRHGTGPDDGFYPNAKYGAGTVASAGHAKDGGAMKDSTFTTGQVTKLYEIEKARMSAGGLGLRPELQELITRLSSGGVGAHTDDPRFVQAKALWDKGFGREPGFDSFEAYLAEIPEIPEFLRVGNERFPHLVLVDGRLDVEKACGLAGLINTCKELPSISKSPTRSMSGIRWMRCQYTRPTPEGPFDYVRMSMPLDEIGLDAIEGIALFVQHPGVLDERSLDLLNAGFQGYGNTPCIGRSRHHCGEPALTHGRGGEVSSTYMMATRLAASCLAE